MLCCIAARVALGPPDGVGGQREPVLDVPDDLGLQRIAVRGQGWCPAAAKRAARSTVKTSIAARQIGARLLDLGAEIGEAPRCRGADLGHLGDRPA